MINDDRQKALQLQAWLATFNLPPRVINPLRRALEVVMGEREGIPGKSNAIEGVDRAQFVKELYRPEGGVIRTLPAVGALVIEALREMIPPSYAAVETPPAVPPPAAPPPADEGWREFEIDDGSVSPVNDPDPLQDLPFVAPDLSASTTCADGQDSTADNPVAPPPRRRGRPRKQDSVARSPMTQRPRPASVAVAPAPVTPSPVTVVQEPISSDLALIPDLDESQLRQLWRVLHPQGRRAVIGYISELLYP
ncbi:MAG: hypothetical protein WCK70_03605 [Chloroflexales bacterium]|jgi:hypothetical protein